ncbi:MAG TPA: hypothetical protein VJO33_03480 [Gemmatimonadaceae bacterium]|nr:hypothetical protein [Gemmatimonadaceae bacterium]
MTGETREEQQLVALKHEIAERLHSACERLSEKEFEQLVERIALVQRKYEQQRSDDFFPGIRDVEDRHPTE